MDINTVHNGCCLELMQSIPDQSVDMILCDLPYGVTDAKWDSVIDLGELWAHYKRVIKPRCAVVLFGMEPFSSKLRLSNLPWYKYDFYYKKASARCMGFLHAKNAPIKNIECVSVFSNGVANHKSLSPNNRMHYYPQGLVDCEITVNAEREYSNIFRAKPKQQNYTQKKTNYPKTLIEFNHEKEDVGLHPTQKPVALCEYLIRTYTTENAVVLDSCAGAGTTCIAALNTQRNFIAIEKDSHYFTVACKRIEEHKNKKKEAA